MGNKKSLQETLSLDEVKLEEISNKTGLSKQEILNMHQDFLRDCPNGRLDRKLFTQIYKQLYPNGNAKKFCEICFKAYDKDKSGYIDFYEFALAMGTILKGDMVDKLKLAFDIYDFNDDGFIEKREAETIVYSIFEMYGESLSGNSVKKEVERLMNKFDTDNNGLLTEQEFVQGCLDDDEMRKFFAPNCNQL